jgi:hypothetical protein
LALATTMPPFFGLMRKAVFYQRTAESSSTKEPQEAPRESQCVQRIFTPERRCNCQIPTVHKSVT